MTTPEANDVAKVYPDKLKEMQTLFDVQAKENKVYPLNPLFGGRQPRPSGTHFTYYARTGHLYLSMTPAYESRSHTITALIEVPHEGASGVLMADGGRGGGFSLYLKDGRPTYTYNYFERRVTTIGAKEPLAPGPAKIELKFECDGGGKGKGATATLLVNDKVAAQARLPETVPNAFSFEETFDVGEDSASPVGEYESPFAFSGTIRRIDLDLGQPAGQ